MPTTLGSSGIAFNDSTTQTTKKDISSDSGKLIRIDSYTSAGTSTWYRPSNCKKVLVKVTGGGGGAAYHCESGGGGGYAERIIDVSTVNSVSVTVGGGGGAVAYYAAGSDGGTSSFGGFLSASGGYGANRHVNHTGGHGGVGSGGDINLLGGTGTGHGSSGSRSAIGRGGATYWGGGYGVSHNANYGAVGTGAPGSGGPGGASNGGWAGSQGMPGIVVVYSYS
jgi:hypothetical protein